MGGVDVVELFMRRLAMLPNAGLDYPPVRDSLNYYWNGYDLPKLTTETGWPDRINGELYDFYSSLTGDTITDTYYSIDRFALRKIKGFNTGNGFDNSYWINGGTSDIAEYTAEVVIYIDYVAAISERVLGGSMSSSNFSIYADATDGIHWRASSSNHLLKTGLIGVGFHLYTVTKQYDATAKRYTYTAYLDGEEVATYGPTTYTASACTDATLGHAVGCIAQHGRVLSASEIKRNASYYLQWWKASPVLAIMQVTSTFTVPQNGSYRIQALGTGGNGGAGSRYTQALIDDAAANNKEYYYKYYGGLSGGGGGGGGGYCESILSLSAGDEITASFDGAATRVFINGAEIMAAYDGQDGQSGKTISTVGSVRDGWYETAVYSGGAGGSAEGGNVSNITGNHGGNGKGAEEPTSSGGAINTRGSGAPWLSGEFEYPGYGAGGAGGRGHFVYGSYTNAQFYGDNYGEAGTPGLCIISKS